jgi:transforming growth factor-beta-induced protein
MKILSILALGALSVALPMLAHAGEGKTCSSSSSAMVGDAKSIVDTAVAAGQFNTLAAALKAAGLVDALQGAGPFTVFAPTDAAFAKLPKGTLEGLLDPKAKSTLSAILTYHVVSGSVKAEQVLKLKTATTLNGQRIDILVDDRGVLIDGVRVTKTDIVCSNGVIHVIDAVLMPETKTIVGVADSAGVFKTLLAAAKAAGLATALEGDGPFTILAPTDEAFAKLPAGTVESLLKPENKEKLASILKYHVIPGRFYADQVVKLEKAPTLLGRDLAIRVDGRKVLVGGAQVTKTDIEAKNGVVHVIDSVILPE